MSRSGSGVGRGLRARPTAPPWATAAVLAFALGLALLAPTPAQGVDGSALADPAGPVLPPVSSSAPMPDSAVLAASLDASLEVPALGPQVGAVVFDPATGILLYDRDGDVARTPGSVVKILTAVAVLQSVGAQTRVQTSAHFDAATSTLTLLGGGDPSLSTLSAEGSSLTALADAVLASAEGPKAGSTVELRYDASLFAGPPLATGWSADYPATGVAAPVSALVVDGARIAGSEARHADPALATATVFATLLRERGLQVGPPQPGTVGAAPSIATTESVPLAQLVQVMLTDSNNDYAEILGHLAGAAVSGVGTFASAAQATLATLTSMDISDSGIELFDGSGLSVDNRVPTRTFAQVLAALVRNPDYSWAWPVPGGLPIAGVTGTLADRFYTASSYAGAGLVHAKTGTLTGVSSLAGSVVDRDGRQLVFAFTTNSAADVYASRDALDDAAAILASCGCR